MNVSENKTDISHIKKLADLIRQKFNPQNIILFGSHAYGKPVSGSDVDLFVIMETSIPVMEQAFLIRRELREPIPVDVIVRTPRQVDERVQMGDFFIKRVLEKGIQL